jgi:hypothetical protein
MWMSGAGYGEHEGADEGEGNRANLFQSELPHRHSGAEFMLFGQFRPSTEN